MRSLSPGTTAAIQQTITAPGFLVELAWPAIVRLSSRGTVDWGGQAWTGGRLGGVTVGDSGTIDLINTDLGYSAMVLNHGAADVPVRVWKFYGDTPGEDDPVLIFEGATDGADIQPGRVRITLAPASHRTLYSPRRFIGPATGFTRLRPAGTRITWGGQTITLDRTAT